MPSSFSFFRLPILIQLLLLKHPDLLELFYLSLISKRSKHIVKSLNLTLSKINWNLLYRLKCTVELTAPNRIGSYSSFYTSHMITTPSERINVNGIVVPVTREWENIPARLDIRTTSMRESYALMDKFTEYLLELFKVSKYEVQLPVVPNLRSWFMWKYTKHFETVEVADWLDDGRRPTRLISDDVKFVLEELTIDDELDMRESDLNAIIKKWLTGGLRNLKDIEVIYFNQDTDKSKDAKLDHILEGIETFPWNIKNRPRKIRGLKCQNGRDFRRSDGTIATVDIVTHWSTDIFLFHIWHPSTATQ